MINIRPTGSHSCQYTCTGVIFYFIYGDEYYNGGGKTVDGLFRPRVEWEIGWTLPSPGGNLKYRVEFCEHARLTRVSMAMGWGRYEYYFN